jgi:flagellar hook-associated protein 2
MGTVGISFGSPTGGTGFDVSSTVASIVANLQNVEAPWKNQLTSLQSQDTAISSLGTLFSTLSNDISSLTDLQGILSEKTGSSSNTNVLTLTAANAKAMAGTHTIEVANLAQTSSGYLASIVDTSDTLAGSLTLQVGPTGTAQTITLTSSDNTLAGLAAAINSSGVGITASVLTDSSGSRLSLVSGISGAGGNIQVSANSIIDGANALGYTGTVAGKDANLTVDGIALTSASNTVADLIPGVTFQLLAPSQTASDGTMTAVQVVIGNDNADVESTVHAFVSDYNAVISAMHAQEGTTSSGTSEPLFGSPTLSLLQQQLAGGINLQSPNGSLDAIGNSSDVLTGSIRIAVGGGTVQTVTLDSSNNTLAGLAGAINAAGLGVTANVVNNASGSNLVLISNSAGSAGALSVTSSITDDTTGSSLNYTSTGSDINSLTSLGISVNNDGTLTLDGSSLDSVLNSDYSGVVGFFQNANSWGQSFSSVLTRSGTASTTGILSLAAASNSRIESTLNAQISKEDILISAKQISFTAELNSANEILQALPSQLNSVNELYSAITGYNQNV